MPKGKKAAARKGALWRARRPRLSPVTFALIALVGAAVVASGWLLERAAPGEAPQPQGLRINEVMSENVSALVTETGDVPDWIEVYNAGSEPVNLSGYSLLLGSEVNKIFTFPREVLAPGAYVLVYCEGMDAGATHGDWSAPFRLPASGGAALTLLSPQDAAVDSVELPELDMDEVYARAAGGAWERRTAATPGGDNDAPGGAAGAGVPVRAGELELSEVSIDNTLYFADENGEHHDYVEVRNASGAPVNLAGWYLSDASDNLKRWAFPSVTLGAGECLAVHCSGYDRRDDPQHLHTDFRLGAGESVYLSQPDGQVASIASPPALLSDQAWSLADGEWSASLAPSPGAPNTPEGAAQVNAATFGQAPVRLSEFMTSTGAETGDWMEIYNASGQEIDLSGYGLSDNSARPRKWRFPDGTHIAPGQHLGILLSGGGESQRGQYLSADFALSTAGGYTVTLSNPEGQVLDAAYLPQQYGDIAYGRVEGEQGFFYLESGTPNAANAGAHYRSRASEAQCSVPGGLYASGQSFSVELRAPGGGSRIYYTLDSSDPDESATLYTGPISISGTTVLRSRVYRDGCMPSLIDTQSYLYDIPNESGVYVVSLVSDVKNLTGPSGIMQGANLSRDLEREAHVEIFTPDGATAVSQGCGISLHGMDSRKQPIKSFNVIARSQYGPNRFQYPIFSQRDYDSYQSILLRPSGEDQSMSFMRDSVLTSLMRGSSVMFQENEICVVYLNGEYYALCYIRERINKHGICQFEGWEGMEDDIDIVRGNSSVTQGSNASYEELLNWVTHNDMTTDAAYAYLDERIDIPNYIEYMSMEIFSGNLDLLNVRRYRNPKTDGKWRWALYDLDWAFFNDADTIGRWLKPGGTGVSNATDNTLFIACMRNPTFRDQFLTYFGEQLATTFSTENVLAKFQERYTRIEPMLEQYQQRWGYNLKPGISKIIGYAQDRPAKMIGYFRSALNLSDAEMEKYFGAAVQKIQQSGEGS